ncbi:MAG: hypothetical protein CMH76_12040 [Nitrospinae bacterium]|nr:hypothetical protein [Nitrospinota bacterium]
MSSPTLDIAHFINRITFDALPENLRSIINKFLLDAVGCGLYGATTRSGRILAEHVMDKGGREEASLWGRGWRGPAESVGLCLGTWMHAYELDDYHSGAKLHVGVPVFAAAIPLAEFLGSDGKTFTAAVVAGYETSIRASLAAGSLNIRNRGFHITGLCGTFGAAAAACRLLELDPETTANALGLAGTQSAGLFAFNSDGSETKRFHGGRAAQSGLMAADLASRGFTGPKQVFEYGDGGFISAFSGSGDISLLTEELGSRWEMLNTSIKPYCCCGSTHSTIDAILELREKHNLRPEDVDEIEIFNHSVVEKQCSWKYEPSTTLSAQMNIEYCAAISLADGAAGPAQFSEERFSDSEVVALAHRARFTVDPEIEKIYPHQFPGKVIVRTRGGQTYTSYRPGPKGSPLNPMGFDDIAEKFRWVTGNVIDSGTQTHLIEVAQKIDQMESMEPLPGRLAAPIQASQA